MKVLLFYTAGFVTAVHLRSCKFLYHFFERLGSKFSPVGHYQFFIFFYIKFVSQYHWGITLDRKPY